MPPEPLQLAHKLIAGDDAGEEVGKPLRLRVEARLDRDLGVDVVAEELGDDVGATAPAAADKDQRRRATVAANRGGDLNRFGTGFGGDGAARIATADVPRQPEISPDGKKLCFTFGDLGSDTADVRVANIDGSGDAFEFNPADSGTPLADYNCAWSPDGKTIGYTHGKFSTGDLYFGASSGAGDPQPNGNNDADNFDGNLDWSRASNTCQGKFVTILGTDGRDNLKGTAKRDVAVLLKGKDRFRGRGGRDIVCGGPGDDNLAGGGANDVLTGGPGDDKLGGGPGRDRCIGGPGQDSKTGCE